MGLRELIYRGFRLEFPNSKNLWELEDMLPKGRTDTSQPIIQGIINPESKQENRARLFNTMIIKDDILDHKGRLLVSNVNGKALAIAKRMIRNKQRYLFIAHKFPNPIKWYHIALIHQMEGSGDFSTYLGNGQSLYKKTTIVPKGRGPFSSFELGAIDAIKLQRLNERYDWSVGNTLYLLEGYNGYGYERWRGIHSPYIWSGSNHYTEGYYISDGVYSKTTVSQQIGIALVYKKLMDLGQVT